jgi:hypothetical protein
MTGDVTVYGLTMGHCYIEDISVLVPHNTVVTIPAEQAYRSKDLWRAISQRRIFQLRTGPGQVSWPVSSSVPVAGQDGVLMEALAEQKAMNEALLAILTEQRAAIRDLTAAIGNLRSSQPVAVSTVTNSGDTVDGAAPTFIPSVVMPDVREQRIQGNSGQSDDTGVADARKRLRAIRRDH